MSRGTGAAMRVARLACVRTLGSSFLTQIRTSSGTQVCTCRIVSDTEDTCAHTHVRMRSVTLVRMKACSQRACISSFGLGMVEQGLTRSALNVIFDRPKKLCALKYDVAVLLLFRSPLEQPTFDLMRSFWSSDYGVSEALCASARIPKCMALHAASGQSPS